jgi:L-ribulose-5-phosphate 3-epimerase
VKDAPAVSTQPALAVCSWSLRAADPAELVDRIRATGLSAVQLALTPLAERPEVWGTCHQRLREAGIEVVSGMLETVGEDYSTIDAIARTGGVRPDASWPATRERAIRVASVARSVGVRLVTFHAGFLPHDPRDAERRRMLDRLEEVASMFVGFGIAVAFETGQEPADTLVDCLEALHHPAIGVNFDPANMLLYGSGDPVDAVRRLAPWVRQVHVKDAVPSGRSGEWGREVPVGTGAVDWTRFLDEVAKCPQRPRLVIEREAGDDRVSDVRLAREFLGQRMAR